MSKPKPTKKSKIANWHVYAGLEACRALNQARLTDVDVVMELEKILDRIQKRLDALNKIRDGLNFENEEDQQSWKTELDKEFTPAWEPLEISKLAGAGGTLSVQFLKALRTLYVLK